MAKIPIIVFAAATSLLFASAAGALPPTHETRSVVLGPFIDEDVCAFPVTTIVERLRRTTTFANGDIRRHTELTVTTSANGKSVVDRASFNVSIENGSTVWTITGAFVHATTSGGGTVALVSGRLLYDGPARHLDRRSSEPDRRRGGYLRAPGAVGRERMRGGA